MKKIWKYGLSLFVLAALLLWAGPALAGITRGNSQEPFPFVEEEISLSVGESNGDTASIPPGEPLPERDDWRLVLVSREHPLSEEYPVKLCEVEEDFLFDERAADDLQAMFSAAWEDGIELQMISTYRSFARSKELFDNKVGALLESGMEPEEAAREAQRWIAPPGTSEHNTGLALDVVDREYFEDYGGYLNTPFSLYPAYRWLVENAPDYGFILRYPENKEDVTGITYEPWHYRYVGREHAKAIMDQKITLEEYLGD